MPVVTVPKATFTQKLKRFFMVDLLKGLGLTLKYNVGALTDLCRGIAPGTYRAVAVSNIAGHAIDSNMLAGIEPSAQTVVLGSRSVTHQLLRPVRSLKAPAQPCLSRHCWP